MRFEHNFTLDCVRDAPPDIVRDLVKRTWTELRGSSIEAKLREYTHPFQASSSGELPGLPPSLPRGGDAYIQDPPDLVFVHADNDESQVVSVNQRRLFASDSDETEFTFDEMKAVLDCGTGSFRTIHGQVISGHQLQQFGHFDECGKDVDDFDPAMSPGADEGNHYCFVRYMGILGQGRCLPRSCHSRELTKLLSFTCDFTDDIGRSRFAGRSCLDFLNIIPLDLCLSAQMLGCGRPGSTLR